MKRHAVIAIIMLMLPATAAGHAVLVKSTPARRAVLAASPPRLELTFNERLEPAYSTVSVWTAANIRIDDGKVVVGRADPRRVSVGLPTLDRGSYAGRFRVLSVDGHVVEGTLPFEIRPRP